MISDAKIAAIVRSLVERGRPDDRMALVETAVQAWEVVRLLAEGDLDGAIRYATLLGIDHVVAALKADGQPGMRVFVHHDPSGHSDTEVACAVAASEDEARAMMTAEGHCVGLLREHAVDKPGVVVSLRIPNAAADE